MALNHPTSMEGNPITGMWLLPSWHNHRVRQWSPEAGLSLVVVADTGLCRACDGYPPCADGGVGFGYPPWRGGASGALVR